MKIPIIVQSPYGLKVLVTDEALIRVSLGVFKETFLYSECKVLPFRDFIGMKGLLVLCDRRRFYFLKTASNYELAVSFLQEKEILSSGSLNYQLMPVIAAEHATGIKRLFGKLYLKNKLFYGIACFLMQAPFVTLLFWLYLRHRH